MDNVYNAVKDKPTDETTHEADEQVIAVEGN
jgi:hypothetical protein